MPKPLDCDPIIYFIGKLMGNVARILSGESTAEEEKAARKMGFASAFDEALAFTRNDQAERLAMLIVETMGYELEPREWLERFVIPEELPDPEPRRREIGRLVKPVNGCIKMVFRTGDGDEVITLRIAEPEGAN
jgi:hypothetical protein